MLVIITAMRITFTEVRLRIVTYNTPQLTNSKDLNFAEIYGLVDQRKLYNDVSESESAVESVSALDSDCSSVRYSPRILTTQSVVPQNRCVKNRVIIG